MELGKYSILDVVFCGRDVTDRANFNRAESMDNRNHLAGFSMNGFAKVPSVPSNLFANRRSRRTGICGLTVFLAALCVLAAPRVACAQETVVTLDPQQTKIEFTLGATLHTVHGTFRLKSGTIRFDPATGAASGALIVDATSGASGNDSRDTKMHKEIIESQKFPEIVFTPNHVSGQLKEVSDGQDEPEVQISGLFRLLGQDHDLTMTVSVQPAGSQFQASSHFTIPYIKWGLKNPNTFVLRVSPAVDIDIHAVGHLSPVPQILVTH